MEFSRKINFVFFYVEGILFKKMIEFSKGNTCPFALTVIARELGSEALEEQATKDKWNENQYSGYVEWMEEIIEIHKEYGLTKQLFDRFMDATEYPKGVKEVFDNLRKRDIRTALVSGGFKANADRAQNYLKIGHFFAACESFWDSDGILDYWNLLPCDYEGKEHFIQLIMKEHGLAPEECAFVGDGVNDVFLVSMVGNSVSFNGHENLERVCKHVLNQPRGEEDFIGVLKFIQILKI